MCAYNLIAGGKGSRGHPAIAGTLVEPPWVAFCTSPAATGVARGGRQAAADALGTVVSLFLPGHYAISSWGDKKITKK